MNAALFLGQAISCKNEIACLLNLICKRGRQNQVDVLNLFRCYTRRHTHTHPHPHARHAAACRSEADLGIVLRVPGLEWNNVEKETEKAKDKGQRQSEAADQRLFSPSC